MSGLLRIIGVVAGLLLLVVCGGVALVTFIANPSMSDSGQLGGTIALVLAAVLGFYLVRRSSPHFFGSAGASPVRFVRSMLERSALKRPIGMAFWTLVIGLVLLAVTPRHGARIAVALGAFLIYMLYSLIALATMPGWWRRALFTLLLGPVVMFGLIFTAEAFEKDVIGEGALAFLGPLMWSWAVIPITGLMRLIFARPAPAPSHPAATESVEPLGPTGHTP